MATIIVLNGTSSSGKSTLAKALQTQFAEPYLHSGIDNYVFMLPKRYLYPPLWGEIFQYEYAADNTIAAIKTNAMGERLISAMHHAVNALADAGFNVIVDHVILERSWLDEMLELFALHTVWFIGVLCPLPVVEQRERDRQDRTLGQARAQFDVVHTHSVYDFQVDTSQATPEEAGTQIVEYLQTHPTPDVFCS